MRLEQEDPVQKSSNTALNFMEEAEDYLLTSGRYKPEDVTIDHILKLAEIMQKGFFALAIKNDTLRKKYVSPQ